MSYQVLARKWRPATFEQMVGQTHVLHALTNALTQQRLHHAYLFSGTRGVGKTSLARLFAKGLNCEQGVTAMPCGLCSSCVEISEGRFVDLIEVDAASRTKVDDTRELLDNVQYRPSRGRFKVYLIDEVHMLSRSSFNALLKTLEEPPEYVKFLLATTDPQRLPVTVLSRCLQFNLKSLTQDEITQQLSHVLTQESLVFDDQALALLSKSANGSMRDALSLTDQAIAFGGGKVLLTQVQTMLGCIDEGHVITLFNALLQGDIEQLMQVIDKVLAFGADPNEVLRSLLELLHQITLSQFAPAAAQLSIYREQITSFAEELTPEQVQLYYQLLLTGRKDLPHAPDPKSGLQMALLRAESFVPEVPIKRWIIDKPAPVSLPKTPIVSDSDEDTTLNSLHSEQALILSQAASQGMEQESPQGLIVARDDSLTPELALGTNDEPLLLVSESTEPAVAHKNVTNEVAQSDPNAISDEYYQTQSAQFDAQNEYQTPLDGAMPEQYRESFDHGVGSSGQESHEVSETSVAPAAINVPEQDDILDAVLAARDTLLTQLSAEEPKESGGKKYEVERKEVVAPTRLSLIAASKSGDNGSTHHNSIASETSAIEINTGFSECEDRPPWEEPHTLVSLVDKRVESIQVDEETDAKSENHELLATSTLNTVQPNIVSPHDGQITGNDVDLKWYRLMSALDVGGRVRQLAVNSICYGFVEPLALLLKPNQKHLAADIAVVQLKEALDKALDKDVNVKFSVGVDGMRETPLEIRQRFHKELLSRAHHELMTDTHVQRLMAEMGAKLENDSLSYSPELLSSKGNSIELIDKSNFTTLSEP